ncbi:Sec1-like protein, partial [Backusella circina FSU 941]
KIVAESNVFTVDPITSFYNVFGNDRANNPDQALMITAKQVIYQSEDNVHPHGSPAGKLANIVQHEIDQFCRLNPDFPPVHQPPQPRATLLIVDRSIDPAAPLLHEFTYQAMINDLLPLQDTPNHVGVKYIHEFHQADGTMGTTDVVLDEEDKVYTSIRHLHIAECSDRLIEKFNEFMQENSKVGGTNGVKNAARNLKDMKDMLTNLPQYQDLKAKYSAHLSIAQECMSFFERHKLNALGTLEQNMMTGETVDGEVPKTIILDMVPLLDDPSVSPDDKTRLLMLYIIWKEGGIFEDDKRKLFDHARLSNDLRAAINNLPLIGVKLIRVRQEEKSFFNKRRRDKHTQNKDEETPYELSRYVPVLKRVMDAHVSNTLDPKQFAYTRLADMDPSEDGHASGQGRVIPASGVSLRTTKPTWSKKANGGVSTPRLSNGAKVIVFVIGGVTYSEIRSAYEVSQAHNRVVFIGSTELLKPNTFVDHLSRLGLPAPPPPSLIPPYVAPVKHSDSVSKTASFMSHMHLTGSSSKSSMSISTTASSSDRTSASEETKEKKKKKGFKRLFG